MSEVSLRRFVRGLIRERLTQRQKRPRLVDVLFERPEESEEEKGDTEATEEKEGGGGGLVDINAGPESVLAAAADLVADPKTKEMMKAGETDAAGPEDEVITITGGTRKPTDLLPTQNVIGTEQSLGDQVGDSKFGSLDMAISGPRLPSKQGKFPILIFDNYILDGHHRWSQAYATNPNVDLDVAEIKAPGVNNPDGALGLVHYLLFALYGKSPTKAFKGDNLFGMSTDAIREFALANMADTTPQKLVDAGIIEEETPEAAANWYSQIGTGGPRALPKGTFTKYDRTVMPQPLDAGDPTGLEEIPPDAAAGAVNYDDPKPGDVKEESRSPITDDMVMERWQRLAGLLVD